MPIRYNKELEAWTTFDLDEEEKEVLIKMATQMITDQLGAELAGNIVELFQHSQMLKATPKEFMGNA
jgi:hypothetical protein